MPGPHIVVGIDFSDPSLAAAGWTARHLADDATIVLAHAVCIPAATEVSPRILSSDSADDR
ncbi:MAG TPA: universal stress protein [Gemmatimonadales bacterium]|nr:universal stress protein [Gemmatimonadales bacterium]